MIQISLKQVGWQFKLILLAATAIISFAAYQLGYDHGYAQGWGEGLLLGHRLGWDKGFEDCARQCTGEDHAE